jgi:transcriptional antiterminator NusG
VRAFASAVEMRMPTVRLGDTVRIKSGAFAAFAGKIEDINQSKSLLRVKVDVYGRPRPVTIRISEVEKVGFADNETGETKP